MAATRYLEIAGALLDGLSGLPAGSQTRSEGLDRAITGWVRTEFRVDRITLEVRIGDARIGDAPTASADR